MRLIITLLLLAIGSVVVLTIASVFSHPVMADIPVDKKVVKVDTTGSIEMVTPDEIQRIKNELSAEIKSLKSRITVLEAELNELKNNDQYQDQRLTEGGL